LEVYEVTGLGLCGEARLAQESPEASRVEADFRASLTSAETLGMRPRVAHCHVGVGKLCRRTDRRERAPEHLATATTMYREMGMTYWLGKAEAEMRELELLPTRAKEPQTRGRGKP
jgi:hypothetical protein